MPIHAVSIWATPQPAQRMWSRSEMCLRWSRQILRLDLVTGLVDRRDRLPIGVRPLELDARAPHPGAHLGLLVRPTQLMVT